MGTKAQHSAAYLHLPPLLKALREEAGLTQRQMGQRLGKPQSRLSNCEAANRRVDVPEFIAWVRACGGDPSEPCRTACPTEARRKVTLHEDF